MRTSVLLNGLQMCIKPACNCTGRHSLLNWRLHMPLQAVAKAEAGVTEAEKRLMQLQKDKEELDRQLQQTQKAVLAGKQKVEKFREEIQRRTEARTVSTASVRFCAYDSNTAPVIHATHQAIATHSNTWFCAYDSHTAPSIHAVRMDASLL